MPVMDAEVTSVALRLEEQGYAPFSSLKRIEARACVSARFWIWKNAHCWGGMTRILYKIRVSVDFSQVIEIFLF